ncbi:hypothetical protein FB451DRAFT_1413102 [Mycena latifolia]|nr:hypothetical protein FB451DRAFT_1413102 [Mycena latifolia]
MASGALVSWSFLTGVIPRLYYTLQCCVAHARRYPTLSAPSPRGQSFPSISVMSLSPCHSEYSSAAEAGAAGAVGDCDARARFGGTRSTHAQTLFAALPRSTTPRTLVDLAPHTYTHAVRPALALMASVPTLRTVASEARV